MKKLIGISILAAVLTSSVAAWAQTDSVASNNFLAPASVPAGFYLLDTPSNGLSNSLLTMARQLNPFASRGFKLVRTQESFDENGLFVSSDTEFQNSFSKGDLVILETILSKGTGTINKILGWKKYAYEAPTDSSLLGSVYSIYAEHGNDAVIEIRFTVNGKHIFAKKVAPKSSEIVRQLKQEKKAHEPKFTLVSLGDSV